MEKNLKDYAPYYVGCRCLNTWLPKDHDCYNAGWKLDGFCPGYEKSYHLVSDTDFTWTDSIKLILRRLDDITDEEIKEFIGWDKLVELYVDVRFERFKNGIHVYYSIDAGDQGEYRQFHSITLHVFSPKEFHYLLKQGFDLWGLIDAGLAVDEKELTNKTEQ